MDLPLPIASLLRRARNAKSPKERHDTAYFAWEASLRLAVAARPPADASGLVMPSTGHWVGAFQGSDALLDGRALLAALAILTEGGLGKKSAPKAVTARTLLEPLPAYRNQVIGHGSTRAAEFYDRAAGALLDGLEAAWSAGVFWPTEARLVFVDSIEIDAAGGRRARTLALSGLAPVLEGSPGGGGAGGAGGAAGGAVAPEGTLPRRLYLRTGEQLRPLHPWLLYQEAELRERVLFFNGRGRSAQLLDYVSGEALKGKALAEAFPALEADLDVLFTRVHAPGAADATGDAEAADPARFGDYRLLGKLGSGGMGVVYLARQEGLGRIVALKMLPLDAARDPVAVARFRREVSALSRCDHPNVIRIHASGEAQGTHYYAMELVEGADLAQIALALSSAGDNDFAGAVSTASERVRKAKADAFSHVPDVQAAGGDATAHAQIVGRAGDRSRRLAALFRDAARGVHHLHEVGVIHRDLKPGNLMVTAVDHRVVVMDLGLAALGDASKSITKDRSALLGTLRYMPPEQLQRNLVALDRRADVYSLGATLYELVTDRRFFDGDSEARLIEQVLRETPPPAEKARPGVPRDLSMIIGKATEKDPARRYETAAALAADLDAFVLGRPIAARAPTLRYILGLAIARNRAIAATIAAAIVLAVLGTAFFVAREGRLRREAEEQREEAVRLGRVALEREKEAQAERRRAETERQTAQARLEDFLRLGDVKRLADYEREAETLWPAVPERVPAMEAWLVKARALERRIPTHKAKLAEIRTGALPYDDVARARDRATHPEAPRLEALASERAEKAAEIEGAPGADERLEQEVTRLDAEIADLERAVRERRTFAVAGAEAQWEHDTLAGLVLGLERFTAGSVLATASSATATPPTTAVTATATATAGGATATATAPSTPGAAAGAIASVEKRLRFAETIQERSIERHRDAWAAAIAAIGDPARCPQYRGLKLKPQLGLVPIGQDPHSRLFEFAHLETGDPPGRGPDGRLILREETGIVFVLLPGGTFRMGAVRPEKATPGETNIDPHASRDEVPVHDHTVAPFFLSKLEMTQGQWLRVAGKNASFHKSGSSFGGKVVTLRDPVENVNHHDATAQLRRLGLRLPAEAEWEYAARAGTTTAFITGEDARSLEGAANIADRFARMNRAPPNWTFEEWLDDGYVSHAPGGSFRPNGFGLHDMAGNVWEWCADWYDNGSYVRYARGDASPPNRGRSRVLRGGSWCDSAVLVRAALRYAYDPATHDVFLGFRPARVIAE